MIENDTLPLPGEFTDWRGNRWVFDAETVCDLGQEEGAPFWCSYCYDRRNISTFERCAALLWVKVAPVSAEEQKAE